MRIFFARIFGFTNVPAIHRQGRSIDRRSRPRLEGLESRQVLSHHIAFNPATGIVNIYGESSNDRATVVLDNRGTPTPADDLVVVTFTHLGHSQIERYNAALVKKIVFTGDDGTDTFVNRTAIRSQVDGGNGNDVLVGGSGVDALKGGAGLDKLYGKDGNDSLYGGAGRDTLDGGNGKDTLDGSYDRERDALRGGAGADIFRLHRRRAGAAWEDEATSLLDFRTSDKDRKVFQNH